MRRTVAMVTSLLLLAACAGPADDPAAGSTAPGTTAPAPSEEACTRPDAPVVPVGAAVEVASGRGDAPAGLGPVRDVEVVALGDGDAIALAAALGEVLDPCADAEPVVGAGGPGALVAAAALAAAEDRPLVPSSAPAAATSADPLVDAAAAGDATAALLDRWGVTEVLIATDDDVAAWTALAVAATTTAAPLLVPVAPVAEPTAGAAEAAETAESAETAAEQAPQPQPDPPVDPAREALARLPAAAVVTVVATDGDRAAALAARVVAAGRPEPAVRVVAEDAPPAGWDGAPGGTLWLVDPSDPVRALVAAAAAGARGEALLALDPSDPTAVLRHAAALRRVQPERILLVGATSPTGSPADASTAWALDVALHTEPLPWGGWLPLEDTRIVALYGSPGAPALGALGQQDLDATFARVREFAARYDLDGLRIVPGFDVIATVATAVEGPQGDYSRRVPISTLRPLVDRARVEGAAVFIDLQPGRTDFLTQAKEYEELLLEPHVFLALDPEWRLKPDQVHLRQIGSVQAAEVQEVADWLAELVRRERLPQKGFMLHQFLLEMLPDRDTVVVPPELVGIVHVDGQGAVASKQRTFRIMAEGADPQWRWGWKQFLRIDTPAVMDPADVIARTPLPVVITYQ